MLECCGAIGFQPPTLQRCDRTRLFRDDHGEGNPVVAGALKVFLDRLIKAGGAIAPSKSTGYTVPFDPEIFKLVALDTLDAAGVKFLFHSFVSGVLGKSEPEAVIFETKSSPLVIAADAIVDCTGDGDIAIAAGAPYEVGRVEDGLVQPMTLMFRMVEFERPEFTAYIQQNPSQWCGVHGLWDLVQKASMAAPITLATFSPSKAEILLLSLIAFVIVFYI